MIIACDYDGVISKRVGIPRVAGELGVPMEDAVRGVEYLFSQGHEVYILTARPFEDFLFIRKWLTDNGFPNLEITNSKKEGTKVIIDDRAIRFTNWMDICKYFG